MTEKVRKRERGPTALHTGLVGFYVDPVESSTCDYDTSVNLVSSSHALRCAVDLSQPLNNDFTGEFRRLWDLESLGISSPEQSVHWQNLLSARKVWSTSTMKEHSPSFARQLWDQLQMPDESIEPPEMTTTSISRIRCRDQRLDRKEAYGESQWTNLWWSRKGSLPASSCCHKKRQRQQNSELSVIRPVSQTESPWLYTGQVLSQKIMDIFLRFQTHRKALAGDIKKAFLNKLVSEEDRDVLRFLFFSCLYTRESKKLEAFSQWRAGGTALRTAILQTFH